jgi:two-component system cell cycle response regulator
LQAEEMSNDTDDTTQKLQLHLPLSTTVLIVDDDCLVLARLQELVSAAGYSVRTAANGSAALQSLEIAPASIVITDLNMPGMDGLELCRNIRERTWPGYIYIVLLTVRDEEKDILAGLDAGADDYMSKRTSTAQFTARLRTAKRILALEYTLKNALEKKRQLAMSDALTGAYNRRYFARHLSRELKRAQRFGGHVSLLLLDIDQFKRVNDTHGHAVGDIVLKAVSAQIENCFRRATDWCARLGGDEFAVVLEGTRVADGRVCAEKLRGAIADSRIDTPAGAICITVSIGISGLEGIIDRSSATVETLLEHADANLYASKANGRNCVTSLNSNVAHVGARTRANQWSHHANTQSSVRTLR